MPLLPLGSQLVAASLLAATSTKKTSSSSSIVLLLFIVAFLAIYFLWLRPQRMKLRQRQFDTQRQIDVGDEIVTTSGIVGRVQGFDGDRVRIEVSPGTSIEIVRAAIGRRLEPPPSPDLGMTGSVGGGDDPDRFNPRPPGGTT